MNRKQDKWDRLAKRIIGDNGTLDFLGRLERLDPHGARHRYAYVDSARYEVVSSYRECLADAMRVTATKGK